MTRTPQLILGVVLLALGAWGLLAPQMSSEPLPGWILLLRAFVVGILIALGLFVLFLGRIIRFLRHHS